jgi:hypothetical protein
MTKINVDPRIEIRPIADGEIHIIFTWTKDDLAQMAKAFLAVSDGRLAEKDAKMVFRLRNKDGIDYLISKLLEARKELFGDATD